MKKITLVFGIVLLAIGCCFAVDRFGDKKEIKGAYKITEDTFQEITYVEPKKAWTGWHMKSDGFTMKFSIIIKEKAYWYILDYHITEYLTDSIAPIDKIIFKYGDKKCTLYFGNHKVTVDSNPTALGDIKELEAVGLVVQKDVIETLYEILNTEGFEYAVYFTDSTADRGPNDRRQCISGTKPLKLILDFTENYLADYVYLGSDAAVTLN